MAKVMDYSKVQYLGLLAPSLLALIAGLVIHPFIIGVNVTDWWKGRSVTPVDHIVTSLGITRIFAQCALTLIFFLMKLYPYFNLDILYLVYCFFAFSNIWLTVVLSIVLCLKISNLHTRLFLYLRRMIVHRTVHLIVASLLLSAINSFIPMSINKFGTYTSTMNKQFKNCSYIAYLYYVTVGDFFPLLFYSIFSFLLFTSLYHHTTRMKMSSNVSINLETYYSAMRLVFFTFAYKTLYFFIDVLHSFYKHFYCLDLQHLLIVLEFLPVLHSSYLIYRTAKLRNQMSNVIDLLLRRKTTET